MSESARGPGPTDAGITAELGDLFAGSPMVAVLELDGARRVRSCNAAGETLFGAPRASLVGRSLEDLAPELGAVDETSGAPRELFVRAADGGERWSLANLLPTPSPREGWVGLFVDITARKRFERTAHAITKGVSTLTGAPFFRKLVESIAQELCVSHALLCERVDESTLRALAFHGVEGPEVPFEFDVAGSPCSQVLARNEPYAVASSVRDQFDHPSLGELDAEGYLGLPLVSGRGEVIGLLAVLDTHELLDLDYKLAALSLFAPRAAAEIERAHKDARRASRERRRGNQSATLIELATLPELERGDFEGQVRAITRAAVRTIQLARAGVWLLRSGDTSLECESRFDAALGEHDGKDTVPIGPASAYRKALDEQRCIVTGPDSDGPASELEPVLLEGGTALHAPVRLSGRVVGVVIAERAGDGETWKSDEEHFVSSISDLVALSLEAWQVRQARQDLSWRNRELSALHRLSQISLQAKSLDAALDELAGEIAGVTGFPIVGIKFYDPDRRVLTMRAFRGPTPKELPEELPVDESLSGRVVLSGQPLVETRALERGAYSPGTLRTLSVSTYVCVPMFLEQRVVGTLSLGHQETVPVEAHLVPLATNLAAAVAGLAERLRAREQEERLKDQLRQAQKLEAVGTLAGGVAHDFNNILTGILGYTYLLKQCTDPDGEPWRHANTIEKAAQRASQLTNQLLGFASEGKQESVIVDVHAVVDEVAQLLERTVGPEIVVERDFGARRSTVLGDPSQIHQVLLNLAVNARDAMPDGGRLRFTTRELEAAFVHDRYPVLADAPTLEVVVTDSGQGIPANILDRVMEPFFTTKDKSEHPGSGMGLATAYGIVQGHGGTLALESTEGAGTIVRVLLPLTADAGSPPAPPPKEPVRGRGHVLIVDDEELVRDVAADLLRSVGYTVETASDGVEGVEAYLRSKSEIDLVLLDIVMPRMGGLECLQALKRIDPDVRVLLSSGWQQGGSEDRARIDGAAGFLRKPYQLNALSDAVARVLADSPRARD